MYPKMLLFTVSMAAVAFVAAKPQSAEVLANTDDLVAVVQVFRHGERSPTSFVANDPYASIQYWPHGYGQLSNTGKRQHYALGQFTRRRYGSFLPEKYNCSFFRAQTTDIDRTHMSVQANLAGIFPPTDDDVWLDGLSWQPIPIHAIPEDILIGTPDCLNYQLEQAKVVVSTEPFVEINEANAELYRFLTNVTGSTINSVMSGWTLYDATFIEKLNGLKCPEWVDQFYPEPLKSFSSYSFLSLAYTDDQKRLIAGSWLNTVSNLFRDLFKDPTAAPKYQIYSAHDSNIATILNTLGAFEKPHPPAYASTIYFELWNKSGVPVVNVWHKDDDLRVFEPITIKGCDFDCSLDNFNTVLAPWLVNRKEWKELCDSNKTDLSTVLDTDHLWQVYEQIVQHAQRKHRRGGSVSHILT